MHHAICQQAQSENSGRPRASKPRDHGWLGAEQRWTVGSLATAATFVGNGLGFAWLPRHIIERELQSGQLKPLPLSQGGVRQSRFYLYTNKEKPLGPASQILMEMLKSQANWKPIIPPMLMPTRCTGPQPSRSSSAAQSSAKPAML